MSRSLPPRMAETYRITTLNINGLSSPTTVTMLGDILHRQEIGNILLQEVTQPFLDTIRGYSEYTNNGTIRRGTAILTREQITLTDITRLHSGRGMTMEYQGVWLINVNAPSGAARRQERESFNIELPCLLRALPSNMIIGGHFNCLLSKPDGMGHLNYSRALDNLVRDFGLIDVWATAPESGIFTHYTRKGATRLDRIYVTQNLSGRKVGGGDSGDRFHGSPRYSPAHSFRRDPHTSRSRLLEDEHYPPAGNTFQEKLQ